MYNNYASNCADRPVYAKRVTQAWHHDPGAYVYPAFGPVYDASDSYQAANSRCSSLDRTLRFDVTNLARSWEAGTYPNYGIASVASHSSTDSYREFYVQENASSLKPVMRVDWRNAKPETPLMQEPADGAVLGTVPTELRGSYQDLDADWGYNYFRLYRLSGLLWQPVDEGPGNVSECCHSRRGSLPPLEDGKYYYRAYSNDGTDSSALSDSAFFTLDAVGPPAPAVSSATHRQGKWSSSDDPELSWSTSDVSGIAGYWWDPDRSATTTPTTWRGAATRTSFADLAEGEWWFHVRGKNNAGAAGEVARFQLLVDATAPPAPVVSSPTHPDPASCYANDDATFTCSSSDLSGITYDDYLIDAVPNTPVIGADGVTRTTSTSATDPDRPDGQWYIHVQAWNGAGKVSPETDSGFRIDTTAPTDPSPASSSHAVAVASEDPTVEVTLTASGDTGCGLAGYSYAWTDSVDSAADAIPEVGPQTTTATSPQLPDGSWWFHVRGVDVAGNASADAAYGPVVIDWGVDAGGPDAPRGLHSTSHPDPAVIYAGSTASFAWDQPGSPDGVDAYSWHIDQTETSLPGTVAEGAGRTVDLELAAEGAWWFHVRARSGSGRWGPAAHMRVNYHPLAGAEPATVLRDDLPGEAVPELVAPPHPFSTVVAQPPGGLAKPLGQVGRLGDEPLLGGRVLPLVSPAGVLAASLDGLVLPAAEVPNLGVPLARTVTNIADLLFADLGFQLVGAATYDLTVIDHDAATSMTAHDLPVCTPVLVHSSQGVVDAQAANLRVAFCPDVLAVNELQAVDLTVDALAAGLHIDTQVTYAVDLPAEVSPVTGRLQLTTSAPAGHPVDSGPGDTTAGFQARLTYRNTPTTQQLELDTTASAVPDRFELALDDLAGTPQAKLVVTPLAAGDAHRYTLVADDQRATAGTYTARAALVGGDPTVSESLLLEGYRGGEVDSRFRYSQLPLSVDTELQARFDSAGEPQTLLVRSLQPQTASPATTLEADFVDPDGRLGMLALASFASDYRYQATVSYTDGLVSGGSVEALFPSGPPVDGRVQVALFDPARALTNLVDLRRFAAQTRIQALVTPDGTDAGTRPDGAELAVVNSTPVSDQIVQAYDYTTATPLRLAVVGQTAPTDQVGAAVAGVTLVQANAPKSIDQLRLAATDQPNGLPATLEVAGSSTGLVADTRLTLTQQDSTGEHGVVVPNPAAAHQFSAELTGDLGGFRRLEVAADSFGPNPSHAAQLYTRSPDGTLAAQAWFASPQASSQTATTPTGLVSDVPAALEARLAGLPHAWRLTAQGDYDLAARPVAVTLDYDLVEDAPLAAQQVTDVRRDLTLAHSGIPATTGLAVKPAFDVAGQLTTASLHGTQTAGAGTAADSPASHLLLSYSDLELALTSPPATFAYDLSQQGDPTGPDTRLILTQQQSSPSSSPHPTATSTPTCEWSTPPAAHPGSWPACATSPPPAQKAARSPTCCGTPSPRTSPSAWPRPPAATRS